MNKEDIVKILLDTLSYAYCSNCGTEECDDCHRKYQYWSLSPVTAEEIADKILNLGE